MSTPLIVGFVVVLLLSLAATAFVGKKLYDRGFDLWLPAYFSGLGRWRLPGKDEDVHVLLCVCDHFEPHHHAKSDAEADERVRLWVEEYPRLFGHFRDADGRTPRHTFFYPMEQYQAHHLDALGQLCRAGFGEVEVHLHHDNETSESLRGRLEEFRRILDQRHGLLPRAKGSNEAAYAFIHGNWSLDNSRPDGRCCGVNNEIDVLRETGCYADFTLPSVPSRTQTHTINSIYYAVDDPIKPKSHDRGYLVGKVAKPARSLMLIQGPLVLSWRKPKWGFLPRIENACLQGSQAPNMGRLDDWLRARVQVPTRPDWYFVKLHTHGAPDVHRRVVLGEPMVKFHEALARRAAENPRFHVHYVTAREMYNLARAAEAGWTGSVADARDHELVWESPASLPGTPRLSVGETS